MPIALQELPFFADSFEILNDSILIFNGAAFEDQVVLWDYRNKKRINSHLKYDPSLQLPASKTIYQMQ